MEIQNSIIMLEPNVFDNKDSEYINSNVGNKKDQISYYYYKDIKTITNCNTNFMLSQITQSLNKITI